jgi:hypothetical protein
MIISYFVMNFFIMFQSTIIVGVYIYVKIINKY